MSLEELQSTQGVLPASAPVIAGATPAWNAQLPDVVAITKSMFGEPPVVETMFDPEDPDETPFALLRVRYRGSSQELTQHCVDWGRWLDAIGAGLQYRLSIIPVS